MRISDWSSDVCSSDLKTPCALADDLVDFRLRNAAEIARNNVVRMREAGFRVRIVRRPHDVAAARFVAQQDADAVVDERDRKSVVEGKSVSVRVDLGCRRIIKKKKK